MKIFPDLTPLEFVAINILVQLVTMLQNKKVPLGHIKQFI